MSEQAGRGGSNDSAWASKESVVFNGQLYTLEEDRISNNFIYRGFLQCRMTLMCEVSGCQILTAGQK